METYPDAKPLGKTCHFRMRRASQPRIKKTEWPSTLVQYLELTVFMGMTLMASLTFTDMVPIAQTTVLATAPLNLIVKATNVFRLCWTWPPSVLPSVSHKDTLKEAHRHCLRMVFVK